jgi:TolB-like protein/class 3 adenylate cyclase
LTGERVERRLAAVLAADVAGYSRLMGSDEEGTLARLKAVRKNLVDPTIASHRGRIVKTTGDGMLVEFASAVDAVRGAVELQRGMTEQNVSVTQDQKIEFRIGIHVGDIIIDDNDIFGDGVNVAARLEGIAEPGGVCMSNDAYRQVRGKVEIVWDDMGPQHLKNIAEPMQAWRVRLTRQIPSAMQTGSSTNEPQPLPLPDKPSIAVLAFQNMSGDPEQEYFADGMVEDIITALSRFKSLFVVARNSSFTYKGRAVDIKQVGRELGVRYVLEGSVRKAGSRVRISGQLIEATTGRHLWADKFDGALEDVFGLQDQITTSVVGLIAPTLEQAEIERAKQKPTDRLDSYDFYLRGMALAHRMRSLPEAREFFKKAFEQDPEYGAAYVMAAWTLMMQQGTSGVPLSAEMRSDAIRLANLIEMGKRRRFCAGQIRTRPDISWARI